MKKNNIYYAIMCKHTLGGAVFDERLHIYPKKKDAEKNLKKMGAVMENFYDVYPVQVDLKIVDRPE